MKILLVGAGAVGQIYGRHLQAGGAQVSFLVREKHAKECREGFTIYPYNEGAEAVRFVADSVLTTPEEATSARWDYVILCVSSTGLRDESMNTLLANLRDTTVVMLQPGIEDRAYVTARYKGPLLSGLISLIAYQAPLPGETRFTKPGVANWFPPLAPALFSGPRDKLAPLLKTFNAGKMSAKESPDVGQATAFPNAILMGYLVALERAGWSFGGLESQRALLTLATKAIQEALVIVGHKQKMKVPFVFRLIQPRLLLLVMGLSRVVIPFDVEVYLKYHFTKTNDQTRLMVETFIRLGEESKLPMQSLKELVQGWQPHP